MNEKLGMAPKHSEHTLDLRRMLCNAAEQDGDSLADSLIAAVAEAIEQGILSEDQLSDILSPAALVAGLIRNEGADQARELLAEEEAAIDRCREVVRAAVEVKP